MGWLRDAGCLCFRDADRILQERLQRSFGQAFVALLRVGELPAYYCLQACCVNPIIWVGRSRGRLTKRSAPQARPTSGVVSPVGPLALPLSVLDWGEGHNT